MRQRSLEALTQMSAEKLTVKAQLRRQTLCDVYEHLLTVDGSTIKTAVSAVAQAAIDVYRATTKHNVKEKSFRELVLIWERRWRKTGSIHMRHKETRLRKSSGGGGGGGGGDGGGGDGGGGGGSSDGAHRGSGGDGDDSDDDCDDDFDSGGECDNGLDGGHGDGGADAALCVVVGSGSDRRHVNRSRGMHSDDDACVGGALAACQPGTAQV